MAAKPTKQTKPTKPRSRVGPGKPAAGAPPTRVARAARSPVPPRPASRDGAPKHVTALRRLATKARAGAEPLVRTYILALAKGKRGVMRAGGPPIGVSERTRPRYGEQFMQHLVTLDLDAMPELRQCPGLAAARAVALFISDAMDNCAFDPGTQETAVVALGPDAIAGGEWTGPAIADPAADGRRARQPVRTARAGSALAAWPLDVPARVFTFDRYGDGVDDDAPIALLHDELLSACRAGGPALQWSNDQSRDDWLFQFHDELIEINLGDGGMMWVFRDHACWAGL